MKYIRTQEHIVMMTNYTSESKDAEWQKDIFSEPVQM
jgi:hypothetical protein